MKSTTKNTFKQDVLESDKLILLDVWAPFCAPCRSLMPVIEEISKETWFDVIKLDASTEMDFVQELGVSGLPTFFAFKNGKIVGSISGMTTKDRILEMLKKA